MIAWLKNIFSRNREIDRMIAVYSDQVLFYKGLTLEIAGWLDQSHSIPINEENRERLNRIILVNHERVRLLNHIIRDLQELRHGVEHTK